MEQLTYEEIKELLKKIRTEPNCEYDLAMPQWFVDEHKDWFKYEGENVYFHGGKVFIYPNEFKG